MKYSSKQKRELVKNDYDAIAEIYATNYGKIDAYTAYIDEFLLTLKGKKILDIGCGGGQLAGYLSNKAFQVKGIDFSSSLLNMAKNSYPNIEFINADICEFSTQEKFDGIITKDMLFHLPDEDLKKVLPKLKSMLNAEGKICIIMDLPKEAGEHIFIEELDERYKIYYNYLLPEKLEKLLIAAGFNIDKIDIISENDNASSYASGLMVISAGR